MVKKVGQKLGEFKIRYNKREKLDWDPKKGIHQVPNDIYGIYVLYTEIEDENGNLQEDYLYIGETGTSFRKRFNTHKSKSNNFTYLAAFQLFATKIRYIELEPEEDKTIESQNRHLLEKYLIRKYNPILNKPRNSDNQDKINSLCSQIDKEHFSILIAAAEGQNDESDGVTSVLENIINGDM
ncbi:TPA: GIY-YIG nuclease family protein [Bacillus wiedmannii]|uniref:GIY-YIG nuclease family protein n=1 Tax=Bacillus wiedmannii TaxID=1890302 RepID=UPI000BF29FE4|nr:GIY-YIG nuclease family protein [Bacillus wiedmannii]PEP54033.1 hypothetical protein CN557_08175 [Bacillus wiedmannii]HDX9652521.1 GIY-YIG nuclease family protein [Bacillus wiedmannii]